MNVEIPSASVSLPLNDIKCLAAAEGYVELGMYEEALAEIQGTTAVCQDLPQVQTLELCAWAGLQQTQTIAAQGHRRHRKRGPTRKSRARRRRGI